VEVFRLLGVHGWLLGKQDKALTWWKKSIAEGERLGARPEQARTFFEVGRRLLSGDSKAKELDGLTAHDYLEKARAMFKEMGFHHDLEELGEVYPRAAGNSS
jgi:hypothetical protein